MAPPNSQKRVKGIQIYRPFVFGTVAKPFDDATNPRPEGTPVDHTHSWTVFVKGVDDADITYWVKRVQFKLHESIPNPLRSVEAVPGKPFQVSETGWGEFEIQIKLHYIPESGEKPQPCWHQLRLHPYGTESERELQKAQGSEIISMAYEEQIFSEPYEQFYEILTSGQPKTGGGKKGKGKAVAATGGFGERNAIIPARSSPGNPFSRETEFQEIRRLKEAQKKVEEMMAEIQADLKKKETTLASLRETKA